MRADPVRQALAPTRLGIGQAQSTKGRHEELGLPNLAGGAFDDWQRRAGIVDEDPLPSDMVLAHHRRQPPGPPAIQIAEPAVTVSFRMSAPVFLPQQ